MNLILTNYGHRYATELLKSPVEKRVNQSPENKELLNLLVKVMIPYSDNVVYNNLIERGFIETVPETTKQADIALRYRRNPLKHVSRITFEYSTFCNFNCLHCRSGKVKRITETDVELLKSTADVFVNLGIRRFDFIGGEISKYGNGWLELVSHIQSHANMVVTLYTNGWWLCQKNFTAAGKNYPTVTDYLADLKQSGITHILFSVDGPEIIHDKWRKKPGLYKRILTGFELVKKAGIYPRVSIVIRPDDHRLVYGLFLLELAERIYSFPENTSPWAKIERLWKDSTNHFSNFIDINNAVQLRQKRFTLSQISESFLRCKAFFRPSPTLIMSASGEVGVCSILNAGEKYGNIHNQDLIHILNHLQDSFVYKLHAENRIVDYLKFFDKDIFGSYFDHVCSLRAILTLIARRIEEKQISPDDKQAIHQVNLEVAKITGHLKN